MKRKHIAKRFADQRIDESQLIQREKALSSDTRLSVEQSLRGKYRGLLSSSAEFCSNKQTEKTLESRRQKVVASFYK